MARFGRLVVTLLLAVLIGRSAALAETPDVIRLPVTKDNSIVLVPSEYHYNAGSRMFIRIKGNQHLVALGFDASALRGKPIESAVLVMTRERWTLDAVTISTISAPWDEHRSTAHASGVPEERSGWGGPEVWFPAVTGGNGNSLVCLAKSRMEGDRYHWIIDPDLVVANALGLAHGLAVHETTCDYSRNPTVWSRDSTGSIPHLLVRLGRETPRPPGPARDLALSDDGSPESLVLDLRAPAVGFTYEIVVGDRPLARTRTPYVRPGERQRIPLGPIDARHGAVISVRVTTMGRTGARSKTVSVTGRVPSPPRIPKPRTPRLDLRYRIDISRPQFDRGQLEGKADLWVVGGTAFDRYGAILEERRRRTGVAMWTYGTSSAPERSTRQIQAWVIDAYLRGATGVVPWQTVSRNGKAMKNGDALALFIFDGPDAIHHSIRLKAYRRGQQDVEYLELLRTRRGYSLAQIREFVARHVSLDGWIGRKGTADAGTRNYRKLSPEGFRTLREAAARLIESTSDRR